MIGSKQLVILIAVTGALNTKCSFSVSETGFDLIVESSSDKKIIHYSGGEPPVSV
jgi:hypothetical protein